MANTDDSLFVMVGAEGGITTIAPDRGDGDGRGHGDGGGDEEQEDMPRDREGEGEDGPARSTRPPTPHTIPKTAYTPPAHPADRVSIPVVMVTTRSQVLSAHRHHILSYRPVYAQSSRLF